MKIGITGASGFIGYFLKSRLLIQDKKYDLVFINREHFLKKSLLSKMTKDCDFIVHLAGVNRHKDESKLFSENIDITKRLIEALDYNDSHAHVIFASSTQEETNTKYGESKRACRDRLFKWAEVNNSKCTCLVIPNIFGPFCKPNYNSVVATFCNNILADREAKIITNNEIGLLYVDDLINEIIKVIECGDSLGHKKLVSTQKITIEGIKNLLTDFKSIYVDKGEMPDLTNRFNLNLFNTFRSYIDYTNFFPIRPKKHVDQRGSFTELVRFNSGGQTSFSTTKPDVTRGNHFHTRKVERFSVVKGKAQINLRRVGFDKVISIIVSEDKSGYVDIPIWFTHNIINIGSSNLYTVFWINEKYNESAADTYFLDV